MVVRDYEQPGTAPIVVVADRSPSTRCGAAGMPIAAGIARAMATIGLSAVYFQDMFGIITFDKGFTGMSALRPRVGRGHVIHCLDAYQGRVGMEDVKAGHRLATTVGGHLRRTTLVPVISDFLFEDASERIKELSELHSVHDVFLVMIDSAFAFELPDVSAGWINGFDVETGESRLMSRRELRGLASAGALMAGRPRARGARARSRRAADRRRSGKESARPAGIRHGEAAEESMTTAGTRDWVAFAEGFGERAVARTSGARGGGD